MSVEIATKHFGATSLNATDDLSALGRFYGRNEMGDIRNARKTLLPAIDIYKMHLRQSTSRSARTRLLTA